MARGPKRREAPRRCDRQRRPRHEDRDGDIEDNPSKAPKRAKGGKARARALAPEQRAEIARTAASARWKKTR